MISYLSSKKPNKSSWAFLFVIAFFVHQLANAQADFYGRHFKPFKDRATDSTSQRILAVGVSAVALAHQQEGPARDQYKNHQTMSESTARIGDDIDKFGVGPLIALGQYYFDQDNGVSHIRVLVYNTLITHSLKFFAGRERPDGSNNRSMPSGHTSTSFATATALTYAYGWKAGAIAYPIATFVGLSRMADNVHWFSDVVAGAFIGIWVGRAGAYDTPKSAGENSWLFVPVVSSQWQGLQIDYRF